MSSYFSKSHDPIPRKLLALGEECHLDLSRKSCTYQTFELTGFVIHDEVFDFYD